MIAKTICLWCSRLLIEICRIDEISKTFRIFPTRWWIRLHSIVRSRIAFVVASIALHFRLFRPPTKRISLPLSKILFDGSAFIIGSSLSPFVRTSHDLSFHLQCSSLGSCWNTLSNLFDALFSVRIWLCTIRNRRRMSFQLGYSPFAPWSFHSSSFVEFVDPLASTKPSVFRSDLIFRTDSLVLHPSTKPTTNRLRHSYRLTKIQNSWIFGKSLHRFGFVWLRTRDQFVLNKHRQSDDGPSASTFHSVVFQCVRLPRLLHESERVDLELHLHQRRQHFVQSERRRLWYSVRSSSSSSATSERRFFSV